MKVAHKDPQLSLKLELEKSVKLLLMFSISSSPELPVSPWPWKPGSTENCPVSWMSCGFAPKHSRVVSTEVMAATVVALVCVFFFAYFSPNLGDKVLPLTDIDFDDKVFNCLKSHKSGELNINYQYTSRNFNIRFLFFFFLRHRVSVKT